MSISTLAPPAEAYAEAAASGDHWFDLRPVTRPKNKLRSKLFAAAIGPRRSQQFGEVSTDQDPELSEDFAMGVAEFWD